jgi:hypothetical protein
VALLAPLGLAARVGAKPPDLPVEAQGAIRPQLIDPDAVSNEDATAAAGVLPQPANRLRPADAPPLMSRHIGTGQLGLDANNFSGPDIGCTDQVCAELCEPATPRGELLPVPSLYRLRPSVRRHVMSSMLFSVHPLMTLMPTDRLLDCPSDHPQTAAIDVLLDQMCEYRYEGYFSGSGPPPRPDPEALELRRCWQECQSNCRRMQDLQRRIISKAIEMGSPVHLWRFSLPEHSYLACALPEDAEDGAVEELPAPKEESEEEATDKEADIERQLNKPVSFKFTDRPLREVIDDIRAWNGINIDIDEPALAQEGISLDRPITIKLTEVSLKTALNLLLRQAHLVYVIRDEVLQITTPACGSGKLLTRIYQVADLVRPTAKGKPARQADMESLVSIITSTIQPQSWAGRGGAGTIDYHALSRALVVTQTPDNHEQVADLLAALRRLMEKDHVSHDDGPCSSACPKCEKLHAARMKGTHAQVEGLMKVCRLAAEAGRHVKAAELARQAYALDAQRVMADPLVYKMHLLALKRDKGKARRRPERGTEECEPPCPRTEYAPTPLREPEMPPVDTSALEQMLEEAEARPEAAPHHAGVSLHGRYLDVDCSWTGLRMRGQLPVRGSLYYLQFWNGAVSGWVTPNPVGLTPERVDGAIE